LEYYARDEKFNHNIYSFTQEERKIEYSPAYNTIQSLFTFLACTVGIGFSVVAMKKSLFQKLFEQEERRRREKLELEREQTHLDIQSNAQQLPFIQDPETRQELWNDLQLIRPGLVFPYTNLTEFVMLAYTEENELLMSTPRQVNQSPNYAIYLGHLNIFENCPNHIYTLQGNHKLRLDTPEYTQAIDLTTPDIQQKDAGDKVIVFSQVKHNNTDATSTTNSSQPTTRDWYALVRMRKITKDVCSICMENIDLLDLNNNCLTNCGHLFHKACIKEWSTSMNESFPNEYVKCPLCTQALGEVPESLSRVICNGAATRGIDKTWVMYVMELERKVPRMLKEFRDEINAFDVGPQTLDLPSGVVVQMTKNCTTMLKEWFLPHRVFALDTNDIIALYILLYKYCVLVECEKKTSRYILFEFAFRRCEKLFFKLPDFPNFNINSLKVAVHELRTQFSENIRLDANLNLEIKKNRVFPDGLPYANAAFTGNTLKPLNGL
jgi:hypothetical protein